MRSDKIVDFVFSSGFSVSIQTYAGDTSNDHKPVLSIVPIKSKEISFARNIHWNVFTMFREYVYPYWKKIWFLNCLNNVYNDCITFISLFISRCTVPVPLNKYRIILLKALRVCLRHVLFPSDKKNRHNSIKKNIVKSRRKYAKTELKRFLCDQFVPCLASCNTSSPLSVSFSSRINKFMKSSSSPLHSFMLPTEKSLCICCTLIVK